MTRLLQDVARSAPARARLLAILLVVGLPSVSRAQLRGETSSVIAPGVSLAAPDDARATDLNPSALGFLDSWSLIYTHAEVPRNAPLLHGGDGLWFGTPLLWGLAAGLSIQSVRPSPSTGLDDRTRVGLGLGWSPSRRFGLGGSVQWFDSQDGRFAGTTTVDLAMSWRPAPLLAVSLVGRDLNGPLQFGRADIPASWLLSTSLRPSGTRAWTVDLGGALDTDGGVGVRGAVELEIPYVGRALLSAEAQRLQQDDPAVVVAAGLAVDWGALGVAGGALFPDAFEEDPGWFLTARMEGAARRGIGRPRYVLDVEIRDGLGPRGLVSLAQQLHRAGYDDRVAGVLLRLRDSGLGSALAQEVRWMIHRVRSQGKKVVCHLDAASGAELYACAAADHTLFDPAGGVRLTGPALRTLLIGDTLRRAGVQAEFLRIGQYKSAPEQLTNRASSPPAVEQRDAFVGDIYQRLVKDLAEDWSVPSERAVEIIDEGPYLSAELLRLGIVAGVGDENDLERQLEAAFGGRFSRLEKAPTEVRRRFGESGRIGVVVVDGEIVDGENVDIPFIGAHMSGGRTVSEAIDGLAVDSTVDAIVLRVDSPGGSALASDQIWRALARARKRKPVLCSMGSVAASGGYYVASAAQEIWADPATLTGSIGIFFGKAEFSGLSKRLGIGIEHTARGRHAGVESLFRPFTPEERLLVAQKIRLWYRLFLRRVAKGRGTDVEKIDRVARGRIWSGDAAVRAGLVDRLGGFGAVLARARQIAGLPDDAPAVVVPHRPSSLVDYLLADGGASSSARPGAGLESTLGRILPELRDAFQVAAALAHTRADVPLARLPALVTVP